MTPRAPVVAAPTVRTVTAMTHLDHTAGPAVRRYRDVVAALVMSGARTAALAVVSMSTLTRVWEILDGLVEVADGTVHTAGSAWLPSRQLAVPAVVAALVDGRDGPLVELLALPVTNRAAIVEELRGDLDELEVADGVSPEQLHLITLAALVELAPDHAHVHAAFAAAAVPARTAHAQRIRRRLTDRERRWVTDTIDRLTADAGIVVDATAVTRHA